MKKNIYFIIILIILGILVSGCQSVIPDEDLSRATREVFQLAPASPNTAISGSVNLNVKTDIVTVSLKNAIPETNYWIIAKWNFLGSSYSNKDWYSTSNSRGVVREKLTVGLLWVSPTLWDADDLVVEVWEQLPGNGYKQVLFANIVW